MGPFYFNKREIMSQNEAAVPQDEVKPKPRGRRPKKVDDASPKHEARIREKSDKAEYDESRVAVGECYFLDGVKLKKAKFDVLGNKKTEYVLNVVKYKDQWEHVQKKLAKLTGLEVGFLENKLILKNDKLLKKYLLEPGKAGF